MWKLKRKVEICKLPSMTPVFLPRYQKARKLSLVLVRAPRSGISMDRPEPSPHASGYPVCLLASLSRTAPRRLHYQASGRNAAGLVPSGTRWRPHHKRGWCDLARLQAPPIYNYGARKHRMVRGMQTSLNTRPKPRAST